MEFLRFKFFQKETDLLCEDYEEGNGRIVVQVMNFKFFSQVKRESLITSLACF